MSAKPSVELQRAPLMDGWRHATAAVRATARLAYLRGMAYLINVIRIPLSPLAVYGVAYLAYQAAGRATAQGVDVAGFLLIGSFGNIMVMSAVWETGSAIENERFEGTIAALFLSPVSRVAVIAGHGLGGLAFLMPSLLVVSALGLALGAKLDISSPAAGFVAAFTLLVASLSLGMLLASAFVLTRRANLMANVMQHPLYLLGGFIVPRDEFPGWLHAISNAMPLAHAVDALRAATLTGSSLSDIGMSLVWALTASVGCAALGILGLRRVEHAAKRSGQLELY